MQGRLSPPVSGKIQAFPWNTWEEEFSIAHTAEFEEIEFVFEFENYENNPIFVDNGLKKIESLSKDTGVSVNYICADYFMEMPFVRVSEDVRKKNKEILTHLIKQCKKIGVRGIEIPFVDNSRIENKEEMEIVADCLKECLRIAEECNVKIGLETSLNPDDFLKLVEIINHPFIEITYDTGNSASLGYDTEEELLKLGKYIRNIHIKDRVFGGGTVPLGEGDVDFDLFFKVLRKISYSGSLILQTARGGDDVATAKEYVYFVRRYLKKYF